MFTLSLLLFGYLLTTCNANSNRYRNSDNEKFSYDRWIETTKPPALGMILPSLVIGIIIVAGLVLLFKSGVCSKKPPVKEGEEEEGPEEQINLILCHEDKAKFEYVLILRVGCPTPNFDMRKGYIDLEILDMSDDMLGNQVRFKCSLLKDQICGEMHMLIGSLKPLKPLSSKGKNRISGIRISHGDPFGSIFLYEYVLVNATNDNIIEVRRFNTYITKRHVIYRGVPVEDFEDRNEEEGMNFPDMPQVLLTNIEALIIVALVIVLAGSLVMIFEYYNWYPVNQMEDGSLFRSLLSVLFVTILVTPLGMIVLIFKFYIKKNLLMHEYSINEANVQHWRCLSQTFLGFMTTVSLALSAILILYGRQISFTKSMYWFSSTLIIAILLVGTWLTLNDWIWFLSFFENESLVVVAAMLDRKRESAMRRFYASHSRTRKIRNKTIFFSNRFTRRISTRSSSNAHQWSIGPKLFNPRLVNKKQKVTKVKLAKMNLSNPKTVSSRGKKIKSQKQLKSLKSQSNKATLKFKKSTSNKGKSKSTSKNSRRKCPTSHTDHTQLLKS